MTSHFSMSSFVIGVMLGILLTGAWFFGNTSTFFMKVPSSSVIDTNTNNTSQKSGAVSIIDQIAGDTVIVESVTVPQPGVWIAVREMNGNSLGNVLGAVRVNGPRSFVSVSLLRATEPNHSYAVELYRDDNNGEFNPSANSVYVDFTTGESVIEYFKTTEI